MATAAVPEGRARPGPRATLALGLLIPAAFILGFLVGNPWPGQSPTPWLGSLIGFLLAQAFRGVPHPGDCED